MNEPPSDELIRSEFPQAVERKSGSPDEELEAIRDDLGALVARGVLPERMPQFNDNDALPPDQVHTWQLIDDESVSRSVPENSDCGQVQLGSANDEALWCNKGEGYEASTSWVIAGDGRDILSDYGHELSQVLSGGPGDDIIDADLGNDVLYFGRGWGRDIVAIRCEGGAPEPGGVPRYRDSRYVVFGRGVRPADLTWISSKEIEDRSTGSRIRFVEEPCANFLAVEPGDVPLPPGGQSSAIPPVPPASWVMQ